MSLYHVLPLSLSLSLSLSPPPSVQEHTTTTAIDITVTNQQHLMAALAVTENIRCKSGIQKLTTSLTFTRSFVRSFVSSVFVTENEEESNSRSIEKESKESKLGLRREKSYRGFSRCFLVSLKG
ncbi:unnamed protein product [Camellia sinensis]